ncbi:MAG: PhzF family phenazine biosynthesis isomerase [Pseudomonadota bacterium]
MARARRVIWADAFTTQVFGGNPCAVVFDADDVPVETRIAVTRETRLSECSFIVRSEIADFGARYYLASGEILMAGHPTVATAAALDRAGLLEGRDSFTLEVGVGVMPVEIDRSGPVPIYTMTQPAPRFGRRYSPEEIAPLVGLAPEDILGTPQSVATGNMFCITRLRDHAALARARLDAPALLEARKVTDFWEPFLFVTEGFTPEGDTAARLLLPPPEPPEDPFTGSATGSLASYLWSEGLIERSSFTAEQGHGMDRPGTAKVTVLGARDAIEGVRVGGPAAVLMDGEIFL